MLLTLLQVAQLVMNCEQVRQVFPTAKVPGTQKVQVMAVPASVVAVQSPQLAMRSVQGAQAVPDDFL